MKCNYNNLIVFLCKMMARVYFESACELELLLLHPTLHRCLKHCKEYCKENVNLYLHRHLVFFYKTNRHLCHLIQPCYLKIIFDHQLKRHLICLIPNCSLNTLINYCILTNDV